MASIDDIVITDEIIEAVVMAQLYREDIILALRKKITQKFTNKEFEYLYKKIITLPEYQDKKKQMIETEKLSLVDDDVDTINLYYNKLLQDAQREGKFEVALRVLNEIRKLKAIENEQMKFEIVIKVEPPKERTDEEM